MITTILFQNFGPFKHLHIKLEPLTILCGDNGSGKSLIWNTILSVRDSLSNDKYSLVNLYKNNCHKDTISLIKFNIKIVKNSLEYNLLKFLIIDENIENDFTIELTFTFYKKYSLYEDIDLGLVIKIKEFPQIHICNKKFLYIIGYIFKGYYTKEIKCYGDYEFDNNIVKNNIILNHPETGYHPNVQLQIADHILYLMKHNKNIIVETHSDHIINRLMRRVNEDIDSYIIDNTVIYNLSGKDNVKCEEVKIGQYGIADWPNGFFDQVADEASKTIMAGIAKSKILRGE